MRFNSFSNLHTGSLALFASTVSATLPYNPTRAFISPNTYDHVAYVFSPASKDSLGRLLAIDVSSGIDSSDPPFSTITPSLPFDDIQKAYTPVIDESGNLTVYVGNCADGAGGSELWLFVPDSQSKIGNGTWSKQSLSAGNEVTNQDTLGAYYLASGLSFTTSSANDAWDSTLFVFGGMCPTAEGTVDNWTSAASYSNTMLTLEPVPSSLAGTPESVPFELGVSSSRGPPVAEAAFTITGLPPTFSNSSSNDSRQQNFVLIGGHTKQAFINMSQIALFSLPEQSWTFLPVDQPSAGRTDLAARSVTEVEPRSGHSAVLTSDGLRIIVFGGWVGDINTPAEPQLAVLEAGQGYGGSGDWAWSVPDSQGPGLASGAGIYGHGAFMLPGDIMMIVGGYGISAPSSKRATQDSTSSPNANTYLYNTTSSTWISDYPSSAHVSKPSSGSKSGPLKSPSQKAGLGAGLALGFSAIGGIVIVYLLYSRRLRKRHAAREKELRDLALAAQRLDTNTFGDGGMNPARQMTHKRNNSGQDPYPWAPNSGTNGSFGDGPAWKDRGSSEAERTGLLVEIPSPTRGLRRSLHSRGAFVPAPGINNGPRIHGTGGIHPIDEREEYEEGDQRAGPSRRPEMSQRQHSDPFKDPPVLLGNPLLNTAQFNPAQERALEIQGWVDDWQAAERIMTMSTQGRRSPDKSDRTSSTLSEQSTRSNYSINSIQRSMGTVSRSLSQRTQDLFLWSSSANQQSSDPSKATQLNQSIPLRNPSPERQPTANIASSATLNPNRRSQSLTINSMRPQADVFTSSAHPGATFSQLRTESEALLGDGPAWATPPESPIKASRSRGLGWMGSFRRALTGLGGAAAAAGRARSNSVSPDRDVYGDRSANSSPTKRYYAYPGSSDLPRRAASAGAAMWRRKQGPTDWDAERASPSPTHGNVVDLSGPIIGPGANVTGDTEVEWDVEAAVERRLVQVMFTVPKEKLRVVNPGDGDSLSVSDVGGDDAVTAPETIPETEPAMVTDTVFDAETDGNLRDDDYDPDFREKGKARGKGKEIIRKPVP